ncbi:MAG: hydantoinase/oxoprolinase family protein [Anaerolineae bacterium]|nr:hydantoinase/oxoprolinase family protein [Anaerolineae bacterium]MBN8617634.1 hydantoinase/oxoprolinase family protein [Anaerolineae bacterium]
MRYVLAVDIGGTCTDSVIVDENGRIALGKAFSTPPDFSTGILDSLRVAATDMQLSLENILHNTQLFLHSTTVAENAVVDGTLAHAGLITTRGFEQTLFSTRGGYGRWSGLTEDEKRNPIDTEKLPPIISISHIRGVKERTDTNGRILYVPDEAEIESAVQSLLEAGVEALGVCLLWAIVNPESEKRIGEIIRKLSPNTFLTLSHEIAPIVGEYERTSTVALNSRLGPVVKKYIDNLQEKLINQGFKGSLLVAQAYGGLLPAEKALASPVGMIESGPVAGLVGSRHLGNMLGHKNIIAADMGGTTFKVGVVREGAIEYQRESMVLRYHYTMPKFDVVSLGLAGGSIISVDRRTGIPQVGPKSAGSYPGPICYENGGEEPTVTDVDAILGYLNPNFFLGGRKSLNIEKAAAVFKEKVADPLGRSVPEAAAAIYRLANSMIYDLLHKVTIQRGLDPRQFTLFSFGGTAGMHIAAYGDELGVAQIVIPHSASVHSAFGLTTSNIVHEDQTIKPMTEPWNISQIQSIYDQLTEKVTAQLLKEGFSRDAITIERSIDMRYRRQVHILTAPMDNNPVITSELLEKTIEQFAALYEGRYGKDSAYREAGIELVSYRVRGAGTVKTPQLNEYDFGNSAADHAVVDTRQAWVEKAKAFQQVKGYDFNKLVPGNRIPGPAIIWTPFTTVVTNPDQVAHVDKYKNLIIAREVNS